MTQNYPLAINLGTEAGLATYIQAVNNIPVLSAEEEQKLARLYHHEGDLDAARQLILSQLHAVVRTARRFKGYGLPMADLIQEGNIGLMKAVKNFDPAHGVRLVSFAIHWIKAEMYDFILRNWRIVKVATTKAQRKLFFNLRKSRAHIGWLSQDEVKELATNLDVSEKTVLEMESRLSGTDVSFDATDQDDEDEFHAVPAGYLQDMRYNPETLLSASDQDSNRHDQVVSALASLDERSRDIIQRRWLDEGNKPTLHDLAAKYNVSAERIRQIEKKALSSMKGVLLA
ncbi:MAG: RNA polymerase sigma factor RpoH [Gammaproteobacteria bacterium]|nr:RNA polymerase sigma factor RpoH [Gammaproteobacteria bacterium]